MIIPILISVLAVLIIGALWYGPLFGKQWMQIIGDCPKPTTVGMLKLLGLQAVASLVFTAMLYFIFQVLGSATPVQVVASTLFVWFGFVLPVLAGAVLWNGKSARLRGIQFLLMAGGQLAMIVASAVVFIAFVFR